LDSDEQDLQDAEVPGWRIYRVNPVQPVKFFAMVWVLVGMR
jgi:hypothetical protein